MKENLNLPTSIDQIQAETATYFASLGAFLRCHKSLLIHLTNCPLDHIAIKGRDKDHFEKYLKALVPVALRINLVEMERRRIATVILERPIPSLLFGQTNCLEVIEPKPEKTGRGFVGLEHIELYCPNLGAMAKLLKQENVTFKFQASPAHQTLVVLITSDGRELKFTNRSLREIEEEQTAKKQFFLFYQRK